MPIAAYPEAPVANPGPDALRASLLYGPNFVGVSTSSATGKWTTAHFTGMITFSPTAPLPYQIAWQSLTAGSSVLCASNITLAEVAPSP